MGHKHCGSTSKGARQRSVDNVRKWLIIATNIDYTGGVDTSTKQKLYKTMLARDPRYDGRFYVGVKTTGIYCRPVCPARPKIENVQFFRSKAEAERAGFRPCLRCRPDLSPLSPQWQGTAAVVSRALQLIEQFSLYGGDLGTLAGRLGMTDRHLRRLFKAHVGASPMETLISRRLHLARQLLSQTSLPIVDVAFASGFNSVRRFNDAFVKTYKCSPRKFRQDAAGHETAVAEYLTLQLPYTPPYDWENILQFFERHLTDGVETVESGVYARHFETAHGINFYRVRHVPERNCLEVQIKVASLSDLRGTIERVKSQFDLRHNPHHIEAADLRGLRIPGAFDPFETAVSILLGQVVSVPQGRAKMKKLVLRFGKELASPTAPGLTHIFPPAQLLAEADLSGLGYTRVRSESLRELAKKVASGELNLSRSCDLQETRAKLLQIKGIGPWTAEMIAMRCLCDADAYPAKDLIIQRAIEKFRIDDARITPWRAYLALSIWKTHAHSLTKKGTIL